MQTYKNIKKQKKIFALKSHNNSSSNKNTTKMV
jgi:hypothetical protein